MPLTYLAFSFCCVLPLSLFSCGTSVASLRNLCDSRGKTTITHGRFALRNLARVEPLFTPGVSEYPCAAAEGSLGSNGFVPPRLPLCPSLTDLRCAWTNQGGRMGSRTPGARAWTQKPNFFCSTSTRPSARCELHICSNRLLPDALMLHCYDANTTTADEWGGDALRRGRLRRRRRLRSSSRSTTS